LVRLPADLALLASVRQAADRFLAGHDRLHVLVNNAGVSLNHRSVTADGFETTFAVNHLGPFLLTNLLLERLRHSAPSRIVTVTSTAFRRGRIDSTTCRASRASAGSAPTTTQSWPTCCSPTSWRVACRGPA
jgi:NAD(P)-dependent dehydrogenase (short-subunit alcohol dehydrogenase family)